MHYRREAVKFLKLRGWCALRINSGVMQSQYKDKRYTVRLAPPGTSDILGCTSWGQFFAFEAKWGRNKTTANQDEFLSDIADNGGITGVFYDLDELEELINEAEREHAA